MQNAVETLALSGDVAPDALLELLRERTQPLLLQGLVGHWPAVVAGKHSARQAIGYLKQGLPAAGVPVVATTAAASAGGRVFYDADLQGFNFRREQVPLDVVLDTLARDLDQPEAPLIYVASTTLDAVLPRFRLDNPLAVDALAPLASIWLGNRSRIAAHQDVPDNLACVVAGRRRATLFPPEQLPNLYIGPLDHTPAGQAVSLVDFDAPDHARFPRFAEALRHARVVELAPGDALFIPSMWWHHMEGLESFNVLVNYWWRRSPAWMDTPMNALMLALMSIRDLPAHERAIWKDVFDHYVFAEDPADAAAHIPEAARRVLAPLDETRARALRALLLQRLNR